MKNNSCQFYSREVLKHFRNPKNMGKMQNPDGEAMVGNPVCGDVMKLYIKVGVKLAQKEEYIKNIKFQTLGCGAAIASSSMLTEMVKGKTLEEAVKISKQDLVKALGGLPPAKIHCSVLADEVLEKAIENYFSKKREP